jgi:hypothetical protein
MNATISVFVFVRDAEEIADDAVIARRVEERLVGRADRARALDERAAAPRRSALAR